MTVPTIEESRQHGRLSTYPAVDNVNYMGEGAVWVRAFREGGISAVVERYIERPPHAPYSVSAAFVSFVLFGVDEAIAQSTAVVPLAAAFAFVWWMTRRSPWWVRLGTLGLCASTPIWLWSVEIFKPDYAAAIATMIAACTLVLDTRKWTWWCLVLNGMLWGFALWAKPVVFSATLWLCGSAVLLRSWLVWRSRRKASLLVHAVRIGTLVGLGAMVVAGPHFVVAGGETVRYIVRNLAGDKSAAWRWVGSVLDHAVFHVFGNGGRVMLGPARIWMGVCCCTGLWVVFRAGGAGARRSAIALAVLLVAAYLPAAVNPMKIREFAAAFQVGVVFVSIIAIVYLSRSRGGRRPTAGIALPIGVLGMLAVAVTTLAWPFPRVLTIAERSATEERADTVTAAYRSVVAAVHQTRPSIGTHEAWVVIGGGAGGLNRGLLNLWMTRDRVPARAGSIVSRRERPQTLRLLRSADIAVAGVGPLAGSKGGRRDSWGADFLAHVRSVPAEWAEHAHVRGDTGEYFVFVRKGARERAPSDRPDDGQEAEE